MHSFLQAVVGFAVVGGVRSAVVKGYAPAVTPAPGIGDVVRRQDPDACVTQAPCLYNRASANQFHRVSLGLILLTGVPESLREVAATNLPALSSILWGEFLDDRKPEWFLELPLEVQEYLVKKFGPQTAWPTAAPISSEFGVSTALVTNSLSTPSKSFQSQWTSEVSQTSRPTSTVVTVPTESIETPSTLASFTTSYTSVSSRTSSKTIVTDVSKTSQTTDNQPSIDPTESATYPSSSSTPEDLVYIDEGLSKPQKIGLGVGIPFGLLAIAASAFVCFALCRRRKKKNVEGSIPPASPGFIPRFAFQEKSSENLEHRTPLNQSIHDAGMAWDDEDTEAISTQNPYAWNNYGPYNQVNPYARPPAAPEYTALGIDGTDDDFSVSNIAQQDHTPVMAPVLFHTHSSNRARGRRTSCTNLHSVAEVTEPDEIESPILGRHASSNYNPAGHLISTPSIPVDARIKRKPVPLSPPLPTSPLLPAAIYPGSEMVSNKLVRQTMPEHSGSSSSGLALTTSSGLTSDSSLALHAETTSPVSPMSNRVPSNPFYYDSYAEDYGPEYQNGYVDVDDGMYGGNTSLSQYPEPRRKNSKTEWPLRNMVGSNHRRRSSPLWERIYEE